MVTRKPVAPKVDTAQANTATTNGSSAPYPTTPTKDEDPKTASSVYSNDLSTSPAFDLIDMNAAREKRRRDSDVSSHGTWDSDGTERDDVESPDGFVEIPQPLKITPSNQDIKKHARNESELPSILRPGPANGAVGVRNENQKYDDEAQSNPWALESNNPYHKQNGLVNGSVPKSVENSQPIWEQPSHAAPAPPSQAPPPPPPPVELPTVNTPADELSHLSLGDKPLASPTYQTAEEIVVPQQGQPPFAPVTQPGSTLPVTNPWAESKTPSPPPPPKEALSTTSPEHGNIPIALPEPDSPGYFPAPPAQSEARSEPQYAPPPGPPPSASRPLIDHAEPTSQPLPSIATDVPIASSSSAPHTVPETPRTQERKRNEHYQIKHINWQDNDKMRSSPILTQNENGPCPLLALVNALVLSTPLDMDTPLVETLRTREQVSLGLLLDAVFDELMSGRRGDTAYNLPDVSELYAFLLALHTGMNVNPRFITPVQTPRGSYDGHPRAMNGMHPLDRAQNKPGSFEETKEMRLYSTFNIPLIHGWTAPKDTPVYNAFERNAKTFEDAQNIQFAEAELEHKQQTDGLNFQEQQMLEDIITIKGFLNNWPTQLTDHGLESISQSLQSGQIAILFRNDHFSTLYKEPKHGALMTLVTDQGYGSHAEIVWESLVDVNGAASEHFSGDFRSVSHGATNLNQGNSGGGNEGWSTVQSRSRYHRPQGQASNGEVPPPLPGPRPTSSVTTQPQAEENLDVSNQTQRTASEQEDHDLALALQLQEEEEDQQRQAEERRRRERELSERYLSSEEQPPQIPPRRNNQRSPRQSSGNIPITTNTSRPQGRPAVNRPTDSTADPDAPPTYEQSSHDRPYRPAGTTAPAAQGNPLNTLDQLRRQSAYAQQSSSTVNSMPGQYPRRNTNGRRTSNQQSPPYSPNGRVQNAATVKDTDERCVMM